MSKIAILHFSPLELYPPVQNMLKFGEKQFGENVKVLVFTTNTTKAGLTAVFTKSKRIRILRFGASGEKLSIFWRYLTYLRFNIGTLIVLLFKQPETILYYETISSFPVYLYKRFFNSKVKVFIHFHEYVSIPEYNKGMRLVKYFYSCEKWLYPKVNWLSHTNIFRMQRFLADIKPIIVPNTRILPNYPSKNWAVVKDKNISMPLKVVYLGSLSTETMYVKEFTEWVLDQNGKIIWDIYSYNTTAATVEYLRSAKCPFINLKAGVNYEDLPGVLHPYDVGVILYKGHVPNYVYNVPNKLTEYAVSGLDVWFPHVMLGSLELVTNNTYPKILAIDFTKLGKINLKDIVNRNNLEYRSHPFFLRGMFQRNFS